MDPLRLNQTEVCNVCRKSAARWTLSLTAVQTDYPRGSVRTPEWAVLFCPNCDQITPEDLEVEDTRPLTLPKPISQPANLYQLTFHGAMEYRTSMGPERPFRPANGKTMRRKYNSAGMEIVTD